MFNKAPVIHQNRRVQTELGCVYFCWRFGSIHIVVCFLMKDLSASPTPVWPLGIRWCSKLARRHSLQSCFLRCLALRGSFSLPKLLQWASQKHSHTPITELSLWAATALRYLTTSWVASKSFYGYLWLSPSNVYLWNEKTARRKVCDKFLSPGGWTDVYFRAGLLWRCRNQGIKVTRPALCWRKWVFLKRSSKFS